MIPQKIALLTDSCADLAPELVKKHHIFTVPLRIRCEDGEYADGVDITAADVYRRLKAGELPKTSLPVGEDVERAFAAIRAEGYDGCIALLLSSGLSGTYNMVRLLAEEQRELNVAVFDSVSGSLGMGAVLLQLSEDIAGGMDWETLVQKRTPQLIGNIHPFFSVDTLEYLQRGGRIGRITALAGSVLQIKPIISFAKDGQLTSVAKVRGRKQVMRKLVELTVAAAGDHKRYNLAVANGGAREEMAELKAMLIEALPNYDHIWEGELDATLSVYIGDGVLGAGVQNLD